ncbi:flagellar protein FlgN [Aurantiacibacter poecillastricola]|uniref:flagellar protein FlgN n=1 Tax=Aurantiacibacter poecillastricola TaxID=3064385 RepID=UPI00273D49DE|nr:flagellar protein FlgN [Aurantiacibacter sp. 219JJ12-13]MDP5263104.1 flagellar protein FlgN [Aurantiacibacter sp. 219JJ12-13]
MTLADSLRQMLAVLETERQALAALDVDALMLSAQDKQSLCGALEGQGAGSLDAECRTLVEAARRKNEVNRKVRNLLAANVAARLQALTASSGTYAAPQAHRA